MYELLKLNENFIIEKELMKTKYPFSKNRSKILLEELRKMVVGFDERVDKFEILREKIDALVEKCLIKTPSQIITMMYCSSEEEKNNYKVYLRDGRLCYFRSGEYLPIDSTKIFIDLFDGRTPEEDEKYLKTIGFPLLPERAGKSNFSCFVIDKNGDLYINPYRPDTIQHTFTTCGNDVMCAGLILLSDGKIKHIVNVSGHYKTPDNYIILFFDFLKQKLGNDVKIHIYFCDDFSITRTNFSFPLSELIRRKEFGISFKHVFRDKTLVELQEENNIRLKIKKEYFKNSEYLVI